MGDTAVNLGLTNHWLHLLRPWPGASMCVLWAALQSMICCSASQACVGELARRAIAAAPGRVVLAAYSLIAGLVEVLHNQSMFAIRVSLLVVDWWKLVASLLRTAFRSFASSFASAYQAWCILNCQSKLGMVRRWDAWRWDTWWRCRRWEKSQFLEPLVLLCTIPFELVVQ